VALPAGYVLRADVYYLCAADHYLVAQRIAVHQLTVFDRINKLPLVLLTRGSLLYFEVVLILLIALVG